MFLANRVTAVVLTAFAFTIAGCDDDDDDDDGQQPAQNARVRIVNASATNPVNVTAGSTTLASGLASNAASTACVNVPAGNQTIAFRAAGGTTDLATTSFNFQANQEYTVVLFGTGTGTGATRTAAVFSTPTFTDPATGSNAIRFINASATAGDVFVTQGTGTVSGTPSAGNVTAGGASTTFGTFPVANTTVRLFNVGSTTSPRATFTLPSTGLPANRAFNVVLLESGTPAGANSFIVPARCS